jgi:hypothetical protein
MVPGIKATAHGERDTRRIMRARRQNAAFLFAALMLFVYALFPGRFDPDSASQYSMGVAFQFEDWHSPLMSVALGFLSEFGSGPGPMFVAQLVIWIAGVALLTDALIASGHTICGQVISLISVMPLVSYKFLEVQKDSLFTALVSLLIGLAARHLLREPPLLLSLVGSFALFAFALDVRTNGVFLLAGLLFLYAPVWSRSLKSFGANLALGAAILGGALYVIRWVDYDVLKASRTYSLYSLIVFDLAGISWHSHIDASAGLLPDFESAAARCYAPTGPDAFLWGNCDIRQGLDALMRTDAVRLERRWIAAIAMHPVSYLEHRGAHFKCYARIGCSNWRWPMTPPLDARRQGDTDPTPPRITHVGRFIEVLAMKSYDSPMLNGGVLIFLFVGEIVLMRALLRSGFEPLAYVALILAASALTYELAFLVIGVSAVERYAHVVVFIAGLTVPLSVAAGRLQARRQNELYNPLCRTDSREAPRPSGFEPGTGTPPRRSPAQ